MIQKTGIGVSPGAVVAEAAVLRHTALAIEHMPSDDTEGELSVLSSAYDSALSSLDSLIAVSDDEKSMLAILRTMLSDPEYLSLIRENITERKYNAAWAVEAATETHYFLVRRTAIRQKTHKQ